MTPPLTATWWRPKLEPGHLAWPVGLFLLYVIVGPSTRVPCTVSDPCLTRPITFLGVGLAMSLVAAVFAHRWAARVLAAAFVAVFVTGVALEGAYRGWEVVVGPPVVAIACWWFTMRCRQASVAAAPVVAHAMVPGPARVTFFRRSAVVWAGLWAVAAILTAAGYQVSQQNAEARQAAATLVTGTVTGQLSDGVQVRLDDGTLLEVGVRDPEAYEAGSSLPLRVDDDGLRQPVSEPYDISAWMALAGFAGGVAVALGWRAAAVNLARRRLFTTRQPVREVRAARSFGRVVVRPLSGSEGALEIPAYGVLPERTVRSAKLYGRPEARAWCAVEIDGDLVLPDGPAEVETWMEPGSKQWEELFNAMSGTYRERADFLEEHLPTMRQIHANLPPEQRGDEDWIRKAEQELEELRRLERDGGADPSGHKDERPPR
jgi:hypothetical protein